MPPSLPRIYFARHGETAWSATGQHTGRTDLPLTPRGKNVPGDSALGFRGSPSVKLGEPLAASPADQ